MKLGLILERVDYLHQTHLYFKVFSLKLLSSDHVVEGRESEVVPYGCYYCYVGKYFLMNSHFLPLPEGVDNEQITFYSLWCGCEIGC